MMGLAVFYSASWGLDLNLILTPRKNACLFHSFPLSVLSSFLLQIPVYSMNLVRIMHNPGLAAVWS